MSEPNALDPTTAWMQIVAILTAAADSPQARGAVEPNPQSLALGAQIVASRALALLPVCADGVHHPTQRTAVHRQGTGAPEHGARVAGSVTSPTGEDRP